MKRKLGIVSRRNLGKDEIDGLKNIKAAGFDCFFSDSWDIKTVSGLKNEADRLGLEFEFMHAPFEALGIHVNTFWRADLTYLPLFKLVQESIDSASEVGVKTIIMHVSGGWTAPPITDIGLSRFDRVVEYALKKNVRVAFENIRNVGNLAAILERYEKIPEVGYCYDCGHEHCYTQTVPFLDLYGKRTFCTHLHDNMGFGGDLNHDDDIHIMPYDGNIDYSKIMEKLDKYNYKGSLMLEYSKQGRYKDMTPQEFLEESYKRVKRISEETY